uniref:Uncharacterized protein n=1 Tax=Anguilla anguilla TaxID=7936 RepID=A0A0E9QKH1_ANGAN
MIKNDIPARIYMALPDATSEEALAAVTAGCPIMLSCSFVPTDGTVGAQPTVPLVHTTWFCWHIVFLSKCRPRFNVHHRPKSICWNQSVELTREI